VSLLRPFRPITPSFGLEADMGQKLKPVDLVESDPSLPFCDQSCCAVYMEIFTPPS
jgi:hypothetical protein